MKKYIITLFIINLFFSPSLFTMDNQSQIILQDNSYDNQMCLGCIPKKFFGNEDCYKGRAITTQTAFWVGTALTAIKLCVTFEGFCCYDAPCSESWHCAWVGPSIDQCCTSRSECCINSIALGSTILTGASYATALCAWNPLCTQEGCNPALKCCKKESLSTIQTTKN